MYKWGEGAVRSVHTPGWSIGAVTSRHIGSLSLVWMNSVPSCSSTSYSRPGWRGATRIGAAVGSLAGTSRTSLVTRSEEHTSELQSLMRISYAVFCLKKKKYSKNKTKTTHT